MEYPETSSGVPTEGRKLSDNKPAPAGDLAQGEVDDSTMPSNYANFCGFSVVPEELLIDFGLSSQATPQPTQPIEVSQQIFAGWHTAERLLQVLQLTVERHEAAFGVL